MDLPDIVDRIAERPERFMLYCDDLSFEADEPGYKALKVVLDGSIAAASDNCLIYATSNRRHLMPEYMQENLDYKHVGEEIHPSETSEEKISLSERFGLWVSFYPFDQDDYLKIVAVWLEHFKAPGARSDGGAARGAAMGAAARLAQRARGVAVRARLGGKSEAAEGEGMSRKGGAAAGPSPSANRHPSPTESKSSPRSSPAPDGSFLLGQRPAGKVYAGYWEFPGGKIEPGESPLAALAARVARGARHRGRTRLSVAHARLRLRARRRAAALLPRDGVVGRAARAREPALCVAAARCDRASSRCCRPMARSCAR